MLFAVLLRDDPERLHLRQHDVDKHLAYVATKLEAYRLPYSVLLWHSRLEQPFYEHIDVCKAA
jgi:hypothetical protein